jgi:hypothetical protein
VVSWFVISVPCLAVTYGQTTAEKGRSPRLAITASALDSSSDRVASPSVVHPTSRSIGSEFRWVATAGLALVLAVCGGLGVITRRYASRGGAGSMKVVARVGLSPKHAMYMVQVGHRLLVVGTGPQGAPSLITELDEAECPVFVTPTPAAQAGKVVAS